MNFEFHPAAVEELIEEAARYESELAGLGVRFGAEISRAIELLIEHFTIGTPLDGNLRSFVLRRFPHSIIYTVIDDTLFVVAVAHESRKPGYWRSRTGG